MTALLGLVRVVPWWAWGLATVLAWGAVQRHRAVSAGAELVRAQAEASALRELDLQASIDETKRRLAAQERDMHEADQAAARARADAASAAAAAGQLRQRIADLQRATAGAADPTAAGAGAADRLGDALATCASRYLDVAAAADRAILAGQACERAYGALMD